jgi:Pyruvate/2-oxoacid:ferredoxin oxidoreductase gamma subunit
MTGIEREVFLTGIGGQGVQLAARILALAATREGRNVMSLGTYGGTMRGGNTDSTVVVADGPISSPPVVSWGWSAIVVHSRYWGPLRAKLRPSGVVVFDSRFEEALGRFEEDRVEVDARSEIGSARMFPVDALSIARDAGAERAGSLVLLAAYSAVTGLVSLESLVAAMEQALPPYRREHCAANARALAAGHRALPAGAASAWRVAA